MVLGRGQKESYDHLGYVIRDCPECQKTGVFSVEQVRRKFVAYFAPIFNYSQRQYLVCTTCQAAFELPKALKPEIAKNLMSQEEVTHLIRQRDEKAVAAEDKSMAGKSPSPDEEQKGNKSKKHTMNYCPNCGRKITHDMAYCPQCGSKLES